MDKIFNKIIIQKVVFTLPLFLLAVIAFNATAEIFGFDNLLELSNSGRVYAASLPEFPETGHVTPPTETPEPFLSQTNKIWVSISLYAVALCAAVVAIRFLRSRRIVFLLTISSLILFGFVLGGCPCPIGSIQNVTAAVFLPHYLISLPILLIFVLPIIFSLFYGRVFCSCVCPLGAIQEIVAVKPLRIPLWLEHSLGLIRFFYLGLVVTFAGLGLWYILCRFDPFVSFFRMNGMLSMLIFGGSLLIIGVFIARPYCRFLCPYGAVLGVCSELASKKNLVTITPGDCTNCRLCEDVCPYEAIRKPTVAPTDQERKFGPKRLFAVLAISPIIVALFGFFGYNSAILVARQNHYVRVAELVHAEETGIVPERNSFRETRAFYKRLQYIEKEKTRGVVVEEPDNSEKIYILAGKFYRRTQIATTLFGAWIGLVISAKLVSFSVRRRRTEYEIDPGRCVACGRCFWYCPNQKENRVFLNDTYKPQKENCVTDK
ncbi:MAG: 4Fe-4S binding protein [Thermoguttaceae bacterium]